MSENRMRVLGEQGLVELDLHDSYDRSNVGGHWSAVGYYNENGLTHRLDEYRGVEVGDGVRLQTNPDVIDEFWFAGELDFPEVYVS